MERSPSPSPSSDGGGSSGGRWSLEETGAEEEEQSHAPPLSFSQSSSTAAASSAAAGSEDEEEEEAATRVADGEPPLLEEEWGEGVDGDEYYGAVVWQGQRFRVGDCVEVILEGEPQPSQGRGRSKAVVPADSRAYGEVVWLFRRPKQQQGSSSSSSSQDDDDEREMEEEEEEMEVIAEVRWFNTPAELLPKPEDRAKCLMRELFEGDQVDEVPVEAFNDRVRVVAPRHVARYPHEEVFVCRRRYVSRQRAFLPLGHRALQPKARRARALSYSARRDQAPQAQVEMAMRAATASAMEEEEEEEEEEGSDGEGSSNSRRRSSLSSSSSCSQGEGENADPNVGDDGEGKDKAKQRGRKRRRAGGGGEEEEEEGNEALSLLSQAEARLHLSSSPWTAETKAPSLPCRERETHEVMDFLLASLADFYRNSGGGGQGRGGGGGKSASGGVAPSSSRGGLYIAGFPGTGKTATVHHVLGRLRRERKDLPFTHVEVNGLTLPTPAQAYPILWAALTDQKEAGLPPARACARLADFFTSSSSSNSSCAASSSVTTTAAASRVRRSRPVILVLDEMDYMVGGSGSGIDAKVIYNLLEWGAGGDGGRRGLIMIGLSNTVDLPERVMQPRVQSRLSLRRVRFEPYTHLQVASILKARLSGGLVPLVLDEQGIGMCARKVANVSGDLRKAFQVCRHAIDLKRRLLKNPPAPPPPAPTAASSAAAATAPTEKEAAAPTKEKEGGPLVKIELINQAARELQEKPIFKAMQEGLSNVQVLLLVSIVRATMESGRLEAPFPEVYRRWLAALQKMHEIPAGVRPAYGEALEVAHRLALDGFLRLSRTLQGPGSATPLVALQLQPGDVAEAVRKGRPQELYELLPAELRQWHGR